MASAEEMTPYTLTPAELKKLGEWIDHKLEEMSLPNADLEWGCDFCCCDFEPDEKFYGCKQCMDGGDGESCDFYVCTECANMIQHVGFLYEQGASLHRQGGTGGWQEVWTQVLQEGVHLDYASPRMQCVQPGNGGRRHLIALQERS